MNPLTEIKFKVPFDQVDAAHVEPAIDELLADASLRHGALLDTPGKTRLKEIDIALSEATTKFAEHVLDATNAWEMVVTDAAQLQGLPPSAVAMARAAAESKGAAGWRFTLQGPSYTA